MPTSATSSTGCRWGRTARCRSFRPSRRRSKSWRAPCRSPPNRKSTTRPPSPPTSRGIAPSCARSTTRSSARPLSWPMQEETADLLLDRLAEGKLLRRLRQAGFPTPSRSSSRCRGCAACSAGRPHPGALPRPAARRAALLQASLHAANPRRALADLETLFSVLLAEPDSLRRFLEHRRAPGADHHDVRPERPGGAAPDPTAGRSQGPRGSRPSGAHTQFGRAARARSWRRCMGPGRFVTGLGSCAGGVNRCSRRSPPATSTGRRPSGNRSEASRAWPMPPSRRRWSAHAEVRARSARADPISILGLGRLGSARSTTARPRPAVRARSGEATQPPAAPRPRACARRWFDPLHFEPDGQLYRVDLRLRPSEGGDGGLAARAARLLQRRRRNLGDAVVPQGARRRRRAGAGRECGGEVESAISCAGRAGIPEPASPPQYGRCADDWWMPESAESPPAA